MESFGHLKGLINQIIENNPKKLSPLAISKQLVIDSDFTAAEIKGAIRALIDDGSLMYTNQFGATYLEKSTRSTVRLSDHITLKPPDVDYTPGPNEVVIAMMQGAAFGMGDHPSTRQAVNGLDHLFRNEHCQSPPDLSRMLDIGTGSGILALIALTLGVKSALGIDIDPCARYDAVMNSKINGLEARFHVSGAPLDALNEPFDLIAANLRYPTLIRVFKDIQALCSAKGFIILSGIKTNELPAIINAYTGRHFTPVWTGEDSGWSCIILQRKESMQ